MKSTNDPRFDPAPGYTVYGAGFVPGFAAYAGVPMAIKLVSDIAQARLRAAAAVAASVAESVNGMSSLMAAQWNVAARTAYAATAPFYGQPVPVRQEIGRPSTSAVVEGDENYHVNVEVPSSDADEVSVAIDRNYLEVRARTREGHRGDHVASVAIPDDVDRDNISAEFRDGVLYVKLPKESKGMRREVKVKVQSKSASSPSAAR